MTKLKTNSRSKNNNSSAFKEELLDEILKDYNHQKPEDLIGSNGLLKQLKQALVQRALEGEMTHHLGYEKHSKSNNLNDNYRNGHGSKRIITDDGEFNINPPRDRNGSFEPQIIGKRENRFSGFDDNIISMYSRGMTLKEIQEHLHEIYGTEVSKDFISNVTDGIITELEAWQSRPLDEVYPIVYMDAIRIKSNDEGRIVNKAVHMAIGVTMDGIKEVLGFWIDKNEGAKFWLKVVTELKNRGVNDIFIACVDGLKGFPDAINSIFPDTKVQLCIVHMVRHSLKYVPHKEKKEVAKDLRAIYSAINEKQAKEKLENFKERWDSKYPTIADSWERNWLEIVPFLEFPDYIRKAIYTTNAIESANYSIRRIIKNRSILKNDIAISKLLYLALRNIEKKWTMPIHNWKQALNQFAIVFAGRFPKDF
jgi:putative transposase